MSDKMEPPIDVLLFGDQTGNFPTVFRNILQVKDDFFLKAFLDKTSLALREEISRQAVAIQKDIPSFTSINDLVRRYAEPDQPGSNALESALTATSQFACFFSYQTTNVEGYPLPSCTRTVGSCTGLLAAAAISSCCSLVDLLDVAVDVIRIAFRIGALVAETAADIEQSIRQSPSWSVIVPNIRPEEAKEVLDLLHESEAIPPCSYAYISAVSTNGITISGPHHTLDQVTQSLESRSWKPVRLGIHGPYHAPHLFNDFATDKLFDSISTNTLDSHVLRIPLSSTSDTNWRSTETLRQALELVTRDILVNPLRWDLVIENVASMVHDRGDLHCNIVQLGPSNAKKSLVSALRAKSLEVTSDDRFIYGLDSNDQRASVNKTQPKIAICGLSGRFPNAADHEAFWKLLEQGLDLHREVPKDRFDVNTHVDPEGKRINTSHTPYGCFIDEPGLFDPKFFNMSPREAVQTDPMHRLALVTAYEALEMSGYVGNRTPSTKLDRVGTFYGQTSDDWREIQAAQKVDTYFIPGGVRAFAPGRINYFFKFSGPSFSIDTACSSSLAAIQLACTSLWTRTCDTALAGGMNILTNPDIFSGLSRGQFLSRKGSCATFDNEADGYCRGDGVGSVVLKRLEDAEADKDPILAVILGAGTNHSAEAVSITHPHAGAQEFLYKQVLNNAGIDPLDISYVEMHGTGTQAGDAIEMESVLKTFAPEHRQRNKDQSLHLGAVKANAGHGEAASGITSIIKVLTMLDKSAIPPHCGIKGSINRTFPKNLDERNVHIAFEPKAWKRPADGKRRLFLNNFSAAGGNTAIVLEDGDVRPKPEGEDKRSSHVVAVSGRTKVSVKRNAEQLVAYLEQNSGVDLPSLSYTTTARRTQHTFRITVSGSEIGMVKAALKLASGKEVQMIPKALPKVCIMFTGQGSHYISMAKQLYDVSKQFKNDILKFEKSARMQGFPSILSLIDGSEANMGNLPPLVVQLGATCVQMALFRLYKSWAIEPTVVVGHSLGEYAALNAAGVLSTTDTIYLCGTRAKLLQEKCEAGTHTMLAVRASVSALGEYLAHEGVEVACINGPEQTVISGTNSDIEKLGDSLKEGGFKADKLPIPFAFHSTQVEPILDEFEAAGKGATFNKPCVPVISPLLNNVVIGSHDPTFSASYLRNHCRKTVNFLGGLEAAKHAGLIDDGTVWLEIGAHPICTSMVKATLGPKIKSATSLRRNEDDWKTLAESVCVLNDAGLKIDWNAYHNEYSSSHELLKLPTYAWDNQNYWIQYTNDWTLAKGNADIAAQIPKAPAFSAASVHRIAELNLDSEKPRIVGECDLTEDLLKEVIEGHAVNDLGLCPPSLYCDMAMTIAKHLYKLMNPERPDIGLNVVGMKVEKPLILAEKGPQIFHVVGTYDKSAKHVGFEYYTLNNDGKRTTLHAVCGVEYENAAEWQPMWARHAYMVKTQIDRLISGVHDGDNDLIKRGMAYKLFQGLITYGYKYRGMEEVVLDSDALEATASVKFQTGGTDDAFLCSPYRTDSVAHLSGFIMLGNRNAQTSKEVFVSHGWDKYRVAKPLECGKIYRSYVKMQKENAQMVVGDLYVLDGEEVVSVVEGLRFHRMPRQLMDSLLAAAASKPKAMPKPAAASTNAQPKQAASAPKPSDKASAPSKPASGGITSKALEIIAEEVGVPVSNLTDESSFADLGVDSLLSLNISGKFRETIDLDVQSTIFVDYPTVKSLKAFLALRDGSAAKEPTPQPTSQSPPAPKDQSTDESTASSSTRSEVSPPPSSMTSTSDEEASAEKAGDQGMVKTIHSAVAEELGVELSEIDGSSDLSSLGMDSLMSLSVLGKLREATGKDLPSDFFANNSTFNDIKRAMGVTEELKPQAEAKRQSEDTEPEEREPRAKDENDTTENTGIPSNLDQIYKTDETIQTPKYSEAEKSFNNPPSVAPQPMSKAEDQNTAKEAESEPLASQTILNEPIVLHPTPSNPKPTTSTSHPFPHHATSVLLQGSPKTATSTLFLFPDGSGSATSYSLLPSLSTNTAIYALNSPFISSPDSFTSSIGIRGIVSLYISELQRRQPRGPYNLAGWSMGGVCAYEACLQLLSKAEKVERLILLDAPSPAVFRGGLARGLHRWLDDIGILGADSDVDGGKTEGENKDNRVGRKRGTPEWLIPHFDAAVASLSAYKPTKLADLPDGQLKLGKPRVSILWAKNGVCHDTSDPRPPPNVLKDEEGNVVGEGSTRFLLEDRQGEQLQKGGWVEFVGDGEGTWGKVSVLEGTNHFSMVQRGKIGELGEFLARAMEEDGGSETVVVS